MFFLEINFNKNTNKLSTNFNNMTIFKNYVKRYMTVSWTHKVWVRSFSCICYIHCRL